MQQVFPHYGVGERLADGHIHVLGATALLVMASSLPAMSILSLTVYSIGLVAVFSFSAAYNLVSSPLLKAILRRFDHAAIYLKIAATYTPFALVKMSVWPGLAAR